jgi:hypothetical protein
MRTTRSPARHFPMPYGSGWDLLDVIRAKPSLQSQPFVITTRNKRKARTSRGSHVGCRDRWPAARPATPAQGRRNSRNVGLTRTVSRRRGCPGCTDRTEGPMRSEKGVHNDTDERPDLGQDQSGSQLPLQSCPRAGLAPVRHIVRRVTYVSLVQSCALFHVECS